MMSAQAQTPRTTSSDALRTAYEAAWQRAVASHEASGQQSRAAAEQVAARSWAAGSPAVEVGYRDDRWFRDLGERESEIALAWPLWMPAQRQAAGSLAGASAALAEASEAAARLRVAGEVREAYWAVGAAQADVDAAAMHAQSMQQLAADVDRRVTAGDLARSDRLAARAELLAAHGQQAEAAQRLVVARQRWRTLTGSEAVPLPTAVAAAADPAIAQMAFDVDTHPQAIAARRSAEQAHRRLDLTASARRDAPELVFGVRQEVPARGEQTQNSLQLRVRVPIGTQGRNQPLEAAAASDLEVAAAGERSLREHLLAEAEVARNALGAAARQLDAERERSALLRERASLIDMSFRAGESSLPDTLRALAAAAQADAALARQTAALGLAHARLQQALGLLP